jgi:thiosulfate/3-mercaptopyruvate sulfurtransferase
MKNQVLVSTEELQNHLGDPAWLIFDCRFDLNNFSWGQTEYQKAHIPGAVYADLNQDVSGPRTAETGRHPLPDPQVFIEKCTSWGIDPGKQVVVYDATGGGFASRLWWMLKAIGHPEVALLDGCFPRWIAENRPVVSGIESGAATDFRYPPDFNRTMWVTTEEVARMQLDPATLLIDARAPERFRGEIEPIDTAAGHIPGAFNRYFGLNLVENGTFKSDEELKKEFDVLLGEKNSQNAIVYCGSGVTSCHHLLAMEIAGFKGMRLYPGSWSEWIRNPDHPLATGS